MVLPGTTEKQRDTEWELIVFLFFVPSKEPAHNGLEFESMALFSIPSVFLGFSVVPGEHPKNSSAALPHNDQDIHQISSRDKRAARRTTRKSSFTHM
jgi:hypothetical protein